MFKRSSKTIMVGLNALAIAVNERVDESFKGLVCYYGNSRDFFEVFYENGVFKVVCNIESNEMPINGRTKEFSLADYEDSDTIWLDKCAGDMLEFMEEVKRIYTAYVDSSAVFDYLENNIKNHKEDFLETEDFISKILTLKKED